MAQSMLRSQSLLYEDYRVESMFYDATTEASRLSNKLKSFPKVCLIGVVGHYGVGKSVMIESLKKQRQDYHWVHFDAWKYPDRKNMWEGFILDFAQSLKPDVFDKALKSLDGTERKSLRHLIDVVASGAAIALPQPMGAGVGTMLGKFKYFANSSPATRIFQIQDIFRKLLNEASKPIAIVIEDADRSAETGMYFIETLNHFLKNLNLSSEIKVIIPISKRSFDNDFEKYIKCLDYVETYEPRHTNFVDFVKKCFTEKVLEPVNAEIQIEEWLAHVTAEHNMSLRVLKFLIRQADSRYMMMQNEHLDVDPRIILILTCARYMRASPGDQDTLFDRISREMIISPDIGYLNTMIWAIGAGDHASGATERISREHISSTQRQIPIWDSWAKDSKMTPGHLVSNNPSGWVDIYDFVMPSYYLG